MGSGAVDGRIALGPAGGGIPAAAAGAGGASAGSLGASSSIAGVMAVAIAAVAVAAIESNPVATQKSLPFSVPCFEPGQVSYGYGQFLEGPVSFNRFAIEIQPLSAASGAFTSNGKPITVRYATSASLQDSLTVIIAGGAVESALATGNYRLMRGLIGKAGTTYVKGNSLVALTSLFGLPVLTKAGIGTNPLVTFIANHGATSGDVVMFGNCVVLSKTEATALGITVTAAGTIYIPAAGGTWAVAPTANDASAIVVIAEDSGAVLICQSNH